MNMQPGNYKVRITVRDANSGEQVVGEQDIRLTYPEELRISGFQLGEVAEDGTFTPGALDYTPGDLVWFYCQVRGFEIVEDTVDVDIDLKVQDFEGNFVPPYSDFNFMNIVRAPPGDLGAIITNAYVNTTGWDPGTYVITLSARDKIAGVRTSESTPVAVGP